MPGISVPNSSAIGASHLGTHVRSLIEELEKCDQAVFEESLVQALYPGVVKKITKGIEYGLAKAQVSGELENSLSLEDQQTIRDKILDSVQPQLKASLNTPLALAVSTFTKSQMEAKTL